MMKVSDPIIFGACVEVFFQSLITEHRQALNAAGVNFSNGLGDLMAKMDQLPDATREQVEVALEKAFEDGPDLAMVNSIRGSPICTCPAMSSLMLPCPP